MSSTEHVLWSKVEKRLVPVDRQDKHTQVGQSAHFLKLFWILTNLSRNSKENLYFL